MRTLERLFQIQLAYVEKDYTKLEGLLMESTCSLEQAVTLYGYSLLCLCEHENFVKFSKTMEVFVESVSDQAMEPVYAFDYRQNNSHHTSVLGLYYGALRNANLFVKRTETAKVLKDMKNFCYTYFTSGSRLMSDTTKEELRFDTLIACVPFGLFEPEDLVLVASVKELWKRTLVGNVSDEERLLLAWYYSEQGSYDRARMLLAECGANHPLAILVKSLLVKVNQIDDRMVHHEPFGNGNIYEPLKYERYPKIVTKEDPIIIEAVAEPLDEELKLNFAGTIYTGQKKSDRWHFVVPPMAPGKYDYSFVFPEYEGQVYTLDVCELRTFSSITSMCVEETKVSVSDGNLVINFELDKTDIKWSIDQGTINNGQLVSSCNLGEYRFNFNIENGDFSISKEDEVLIETCSLPVHYAVCDGAIEKIQLSISRQDEMMVGFGERYNALNQTGEYVDQYVYNQYKDQGLKTYMPMPICYTSGGYGLFMDHEVYTAFDLKIEGKTRLIVHNDTFKGRFLFGSIKDQVRRVYNLLGPAENVPDWALGPWMSSNNWDSDAEVRKQVELTKKYNIPSTVLVIEAWSDEATFYIFNDAQYEEKGDGSAHKYEDFSYPEWGRWPNPKGLMDYLHENDLKCILWQIPIIKQITSLRHLQKEMDERFFIENGFGVKTFDGRPYRLPEGWFKDSLLMDFSNVDAVKWWFDKREYLIDDLGVDGFKTDGGEFVFGNDLVFSDGRSGREMRNAYPNDYIESYYKFAEKNNGITFSRAGYMGAQKFPAHWAGDERSTFDAFKRSLMAGLSSGLSGVIFWGWDLAGFSGDVPSDELFIRSTEMATFCPIMQYHAESKAEFNQDRTPWNIAERSGNSEVIDVYRYYANIRMSLIPYISRESKYSCKYGEPLMRPLLLEYKDLRIMDVWDTYMFGRDLLISPVIEDQGREKSLFLPEGRWWHLFEEKWYTGNREIKLEVALNEIPVFVKENSIVPLNMNQSMELGDAMSSNLTSYDHLTLLIVGDSIDNYKFFDDNGNDFTLSVSGDKIQLEGAYSKLVLKFAELRSNISVNDVLYQGVEHILLLNES